MCNKYTLNTFTCFHLRFIRNKQGEAGSKKDILFNLFKNYIMKSFIKSLLFDKELVTTIKVARMEKEHLYNLLFSGKITMKEYLESGC